LQHLQSIVDQINHSFNVWLFLVFNQSIYN